jgi:hypothetical protein
MFLILIINNIPYRILYGKHYKTMVRAPVPDRGCSTGAAGLAVIPNLGWDVIRDPMILSDWAS